MHDQPVDEHLSLSPLTLAGHTFAWGQRTYIMAVLNITPNSFSGDGLATSDDQVNRAVAQARRAAAEGADMLDIGGEATFPGAPTVTPSEEQARVVPVIRAVAREIALPISVDTYHAETAAAALAAGAHLINSIWGLWTPDGTWNAPLAQVVAERAVPFVLTHNRRARPAVDAVGGHYPTVNYTDLMAEIIDELQTQVAYAVAQGIPREQIIIDPGIGFGKTPAQNLDIVRNMAKLRALQLPILIGASRKSFIGKVLDVPADQRDAGTAAVTSLAIQRGADIIRVHNVQLNAQVARMSDALVRQP
ncbi:MAG: dihydropteroate synthase [Chloroflexaceae bacterium]